MALPIPHLTFSEILELDSHIFDASGIKDPHTYLYYQKNGIWYPLIRCLNCNKKIDKDHSVLCQKCEDNQEQNQMSDIDYFSRTDYGRLS